MTHRKILFNSLISEGTSKMVRPVPDSIQRMEIHRQRHAEINLGIGTKLCDVLKIARDKLKGSMSCFREMTCTWQMSVS